MFESVSSLATIQSFSFSSFWYSSMFPSLFDDCGPGCGHLPTVLIVLYVAHREDLLFSTVVGCSGSGSEGALCHFFLIHKASQSCCLMQPHSARNLGFVTA